MQEPVYKNLHAKKDDLVESHEGEPENGGGDEKNKISQLEEEIIELKRKNQELELKLEASTLDDKGFQEVMVKYDNFFKKIWEERQDMNDKIQAMEDYLQNLECSYHDILEKFQRTKELVYGLKCDQETMNEELEEYKQIIENWEKRYDDLKEFSETSIAEANIEIESKEKENLKEIANLKSKILRRQAKINELQKTLKVDTKHSIYAPLRNKISAK